MTGSEASGAADLVAFVAAEVPGLGVTTARRSSAGASRETWTLLDADDRPVAVLQRARAGPARPAGSWRDEADLLATVRAHGVAAPEVLAVGTGDDALGRPWILTRHVEGETIPRRLLRDAAFEPARRRFVADVARQLVAIHAVPVRELPVLPADDPLGTWMAIHRSMGRPVPLFEIAARHLTANRPDAGPPGLVHGDFRLGNLLVGPEGLRAVLDWELAHVGDPAEDLGWLCVRSWRFGGAGPVAGLGERAELLDAYVAAGGRHVDAATLHWWETFGVLRWGIICQMQAESHLSGRVRSLELALIGRRVAETEVELARLLGHDVAAVAARPHGGDGPPPVHRDPDGATLAEALADELDELVATATGHEAFRLRVAARTARILGRELAAGDDDRRLADLLVARGHPSEAGLADAVRRGAVDLTAALPLAAELAVARLRVFDPDDLARP